MNIPETCKMKDIGKYTPFQNVAKYINYAPGLIGMLMNNMRICDVEKNGWNRESVMHGLEALEKHASSNLCVNHIYSEAECAKDKKKKDVVAIYMPKTKDTGEKPFIIIAAGGAFSGICTSVEGFPVGARFNELGYDAFVITYSVGGKGLLPKPIDDLAAIVNYIFANKDKFNVSDEYIVSGFSAGGSLCTLWGTDNHGFKKYNVKKPKALIPVYPFITYKEKGTSPVVKFCAETMYGKKCPTDIAQEYSVDEHMSTDYPPCYIVCGKNDSCVPPANSELLKRRLDELGVPAVLEEGLNAEHGFGEGIGTDVEGWIDRADQFIMSL